MGQLIARMRIARKLLIILGIIILICLGFIIYYKFFAKGFLVISAIPSDYTLEINSEKFENVKKTKRIWLKPDVYSIKITKDKYLEHNEFINIKPLRITILEYELLEMSYVGLIDDNDFSNNFPVYSNDGKGIIYYSHRDKSFYKSSFDETHIVANNQSEKISIDLKLAQIENIVNIKYSPKINLALLFIQGENLESRIQYVNFSNGDSGNLNAEIEDADWLSESEIIAIESNDGNKKLNKINLPSQSQENISSLPTEVTKIYGLDNGKAAVALYDFDVADKYSIIDIDSKKTEEKIIKSAFIAEIKKSYQSDRFVLLDPQKDKTRIFAAKRFEEPKELAINPMLNLVVLSAKEEYLSYIKFDKEKKSYIFERYYFDKNESKSLGKYTNSDFDGFPASILANDSYLNFIISGNILSLKLK